MARDYVSDFQKANTEGGQKFPQLNGILQTVGGVGGALGGGALGGLLGFETGPGAVATGYAGGVAGAGAGAGAGNALADLVRGKFLGDKTVNPANTLPESVNAGKAGAVGQAIGGPLAKALGFVAHPIQPFIEMVDKKLASSPETVDFGELLDGYKEKVLPDLRKQGFGQKAQDAYNELSANIVDAVNAFRTHTPANADMAPNPNIASLELPISQANELKRSLTKQVSDYYGFDTGKPNIEANKLFANLLKTNIEQKAPEVNTMGPGDVLPGGNQVASLLYKVPDTLGALTSILGLGNPSAARAIQSVSSLPTKAIQKLIPSGGGYLNQVFPRLLQVGVGALNKNQ